MVEKAARRASFDPRRPGRDGRRAADVSRRVQIPPLHYSGVRLLRMDRREGGEGAALFTACDGRPLALAGIWDHWSGLDGGDDLPNATIIVGAANNWMRRFHDRMPVILDWRDARAWMTGESPGALVRPAPDDALQEWIVPTRVNKAGAGDDDPALIEPLANA